MTHLSELQAEIGEINEEKGFHGGRAVPREYKPFYYSTKIGLAIGELSEALEELRKGKDVGERYDSYPDGPDGLPKPEGAPSELADAVIRILDLCNEAGIDLEAVIKHKMDYNRSRAHLHGKRF